MIRSLLSFTRGSDPEYIFPTVNPDGDGPDCLLDCADCTTQFPSKVKIEQSMPLYGHIKEFHSHVLVATGRSDWKEKVEQERGSLMEAFAQSSAKSKRESDTEKTEIHEATTILILPQFIYIDSVTQTDVPGLVRQVLDDPASSGVNRTQINITGGPTTRPCMLDYVILLCSHRRRDARCGITAPLIKRELERHLRPLRLYRDAEDSRPGGAGVFFVSHVGGHKFSANVLIYRKQQQQMIWLARVRPEHCEGIVKHTILGGKVVHPDTQLRGGFDRLRGLTSW
ncbi:Sucrase/ferredoxin-like-domain-containing protein [Penicillium ucsense]|uniref:Sucrase/ferredoxin-like-domain-containing protein n=1 Tax=Penicillium ucsense TaxID=2839758 RepID=A0A8J8WJX5_9EURO|nr:Sucrase/ferredoxin-like-domain-containing protein [Penicillium ucsense]KAF7737664.1 Sucrase/ferredoxin-like-domain-containing protein [Penicillium ucsense]